MDHLRYQNLGLSLNYVQKLTAPSRALVERIADNSELTNPQDLPPTRELFARSIFKRAHLSVDSGFWEVLQPDYGFELWSFNLEYLLGCGKFYSLTSYSQEELLSNSWIDLFDRDDIHLKQILNASEKVQRTNRPVLDVTPSHTVTEKKSPLKVSLLVTVKALFPTYFEGDRSMPACAVALTEFKRLS
jgi:hypothetical protein